MRSSLGAVPFISRGLALFMLLALQMKAYGGDERVTVDGEQGLSMIVRSLERTEVLFQAFQIEIDVRYSHSLGKELPTRASAHVRHAANRGAVQMLVSGFDGVQKRDGKLAYVFKRGALSRVYDYAIRTVRTGPDEVEDPRKKVPQELSVYEATTHYGGASLAELLRSPTRIRASSEDVAVREETLGGERCVRVTIVGMDGRRRHSFWFSLDKELLPIRKLCEARVRGEWRTKYKVEVKEARKCQFGYFPRLSTFWYRPQGAQTPFVATELTFGEPRFTAVTAEIEGEAAEYCERTRYDPTGLLLSRTALRNRDSEVRELAETASSKIESIWNYSGRGRLAATLQLVLRALGAGLIAVAILAGLQAARRKTEIRLRRGLLHLGICAIGLLTVAQSFRAYGATSGGGVQPLESLPSASLIARSSDEGTRLSLCGVDSVLFASQLGSGVVQEIPYEVILRIVNPGSGGATLASIKTACECLGLDAHYLDLRKVGLPDSPVIASLNEDHFVVLLGDGEGSVLVFDPDIGLLSVGLGELGSVLRGPAVCLRKGGRQ